MRNIRVVVIDDSAYSRRTIGKMLDDMPNVQVVGYASDGEEGMKRILELKPDLVTLDLVMPIMDGFTLLRIIMHTCPVPVIVISSRSEDKRVFKALELGAIDFVAKPTRAISDELLMIREDLQNKVRSVISLNMARVMGGMRSKPVVAPASVALTPSETRAVPAKDIVAIGASTGGPQALHKILSMFPVYLPFAVVVSQHMPIGFTRAFAERLDRASGFQVKEAEDGDQVCPGRVLIAPGGHNLIFQKVQGEVVARVVAPNREDRYYPSVDAMFMSLASLCGSRVVAVILTGMGNDGSQGVRAIKAAGGDILAESEESAVVFGMPREAIATEMVDRVAPLERIAGEIVSMCEMSQ